MSAFPLSRAQLALWFAQQLSPSTPFVVAQYVELRGPVDVDALIEATNTACHELESAFVRLVATDAEPRQVVDHSILDDLEYLDLRSEDDPVQRANEWMRAEYSRPLDVMSDRLISGALLHLEDNHFFWYSHAHHLVLDGYAAMTLTTRVAERYSHLVHGKKLTPFGGVGVRALHDLDVDYRSSARYRSDEQYWKEMSEGLPHPVRLADGAGLTSMPQRMLVQTLNPTLAKQLSDVATEWATSEVAILVGAFASYLGRMTDSDDVVLSLPVSGRTSAKSRRSGGMLSNIVPVRAQLDRDLSAQELVRQISVQMTGALRHQRFRYEDMGFQGDQGGSRDSTGPAVNVMMFHEAIRLGDVVGEFHVLTSGPTEDLFFSIYPSIAGENVRLSFEANPRLYSERDLAMHHRQFVRLLEGFLDSATKALGDLLVLSADELKDLVPALGPRTGGFATLDAVIRDGAGQGSAVAIRDQGVDLTYDRLGARADALCALLVENGVGRGDVVGILAQRSTDSVVAFHAVVRAGAVVLFVDPQTPSERVAFILDDANVSVVVGDDPADVPAWVCVVSPRVDETVDGPIDRTAGAGSSIADVSLDDTAYVVYTSGSSGRPKGVAVTHRGILPLLRSHARRLNIDSSSRVALLASTSFDVAILEILLAHGCGATAVIVPPGLIGGVDLEDYLRLEGVTHLISTPSVPLTMDPRELPDLRVLNVGGERPPGTLVDAWSSHVDIVNSYGPSEATVAAFMSEPLVPGGDTPIGRPIDGVAAVVLDSWLRPTPVGAAGELYVMGQGLARGYLSPTLTAERFVAAPIGTADAGARMYRTGDVVRWNDAGQLEFLGRTDQQVKIRGVRVELGEIEAVLLSTPGVSQAAVVERSGSIAAYVTVSEDRDDRLRPLSQEAVLDHLASLLPRSMLPSSVTILAALPVTSHGKTDRSALPEPTTTAVAEQRSAVSRTIEYDEELIASVMAEVVGVGVLGPHSDLFAWGGSSLDAVYVAARVSSAFGRRVGVRDVFGAPTPARLARKIREGRAEWLVEPQRISDDVIVEIAPAQQRLWLLNRLDPQSSAYNIAFEVSFSGVLDASAMRESVGDLTDRHPVLRTVFSFDQSHDTWPIQAASAASVTLIEVPSEEYDSASADLVAAGFDLATELPLRLILTSDSDADHRMTVVAHHIALDGLSFATIVSDLIAAYDARAAGSSPIWASPSLDYRDYSAWHRTVLGDPADPQSLAGRQLEFWDKALAGVDPTLALPVDRSRRPGQSSSARDVTFELPSPVHAALNEIARAHDCTTFMVLHACLAIALSKITGAPDIVIGTPTSGRTHPSFDGSVGMFVGTVALRTLLLDGDTFGEFLSRVRDVDVAALSNADVPFDWVVERAVGGSGGDKNSFLHVVLAVDPLASTPEIALGTMTAHGTPLPPAHPRFDLEVTVRENRTVDGGASGIWGTFRYADDLFDAATVGGWVERLRRVCDSVTENSSIMLRDIDVLSVAEREELQVHVPPPALGANSLSDLFAGVATKRSNAIAVTSGNSRVTYAELQVRSEALAAALIDRGIRVGDRVAVGLPRSIDLVVAILAVVRAGAAYVPIDLQYPDARIRYVLADARPKAILSTPSSATRFGEYEHAVVSVDETADAAEYWPVAPLESAAYVIYTSGSTGAPKGVVVSQGNVLALLASTRKIFDFGPEDVWTMFHSYAFDFSVWEMWGALTTGGSLVIVDGDVARSPERFVDLIVRERVTVLNQTPAAFYAFAEVTQEMLLPLRSIVFGGDRLDVWRVEAWFDRHPDVRGVNMFGITETTVHVTSVELPAGVGAASPIGSPLPGLRSYVLDTALEHVPPGSVGELYVAGPQVAAGYLGQPGMTSSRFVPEPGFDGARMYRSGDLVRWRAGRLEYVRRADSQMALRGYRVEPGEVESALLAHTSVEQAAVVVRELDSGPTLVGYITPENGHDLDGVLRTARSLLPGYMVPSALMPLASLPVTINGKIDRTSLPTPVSLTQPSRQSRDFFEQTVAAILSDLMDVPNVDPARNFFDQGANSLIATRLSSRLNAVLGCNLDVRDVFEHPFVDQLAGIAAARIGTGQASPVSLVPLSLVPRSDTTEVQLSDSQHRMWILNQLDTESAGYNIPIVLRLTGELDVVAVELAIRDLIKHHRTLRTVYPVVGERPVQKVLDAREASPPLQLEALAGEDAENRVAQLVGSGFDVTTDPPVRVALFQVSPDEHVLAVVVHHIAADARSLEVLVRDFTAAYIARTEQQAPQWSPLALEYSDYTAWQRESGIPDTVSSYWKQALEGLPEQVTLPLDHPRSTSARASSCRVVVSGPVRTGLQAVARSNNATMFMVVHAALAALLARHTGSSDVVVGTVVSGRTAPELDELVGMFAGTIVLRTEVDPSKSFGQLVEQVRQRDVSAFAHAEMPFESLVDLIDPPRSRSRHPLFQVALSFQTVHPTTWSVPGLSVTQIAPDVRHANFDLQLNVTDAGIGGGFTLEFVYNADLFDDLTVSSFADRFERFLGHVSIDSKIAVGGIDLLDSAERALLVPAHGAADRPDQSRRSGTTLASVLRFGVESAPDAVAVEGEGNTLTYRELDAQSDVAADELRARGVGVDQVAAWTADRSIASIVQLWAIAKVGAAPALVDPEHPQARLRDVLETLGDGTIGGRNVGVENAGVENAGGEKDTDSARECSDSLAAYVVFTSGTSGTPKAVIVTNGGLGVIAEDLPGRFSAGRGSRVFHRGAPGFDMTLLEVLIASTSGATLVLAKNDELFGSGLASALRRERITHLCATPTVVASIGNPSLPDLATVMFGGERLSGALAKRWQPGRRVINGYGPAESTMYSLATEPLSIEHLSTDSHDGSVGHPLAGVDAVVLDDRLEPVPPGVAGELYLSGRMLARGYAGQPSRTAERFVATSSGARMYRTGDLVMWKPEISKPATQKPEGNAYRLHYLGRTDAQVKVNGVRIEPGEIEAVIQSAAHVDFCIAGVRSSASGSPLLVAYVRSSGAERVDTGRLRVAVAEVLPTYMVPHVIVEIEGDLPMRNGKVDFDGLPLPALDASRTEGPDTDAEYLVAAAFAAVLGGVGDDRDADFFSLGGNSLSAAEVTSLLSSSLGHVVPLRTVFEHPTVAALAARLDSLEQIDSVTDLVRLEPRRDPTPAPLSRNQRAMWVLNQRNTASGAYNLPICIEIVGELDVSALRHAATDLVGRHDVLRTRYPGTPPVQVVDPPSSVTVETRLVGDIEVEVLLREFGSRGFDVAADLPVRWMLLQLSPVRHVLAVSFHHIAVDGVSMRTVVGDLLTAYGKRRAGLDPQWPPLPIQYGDFAAWEAASDVPPAVEEFWRRALDGVTSVSPLTVDHTDDGPLSVARRVNFVIPAVVTSALQARADRLKVSLFAVVHAALSVVLAKLSGNPDVVIATAVDGRRTPQLDGMVGMFVDTVPLRLRIDGDMPIDLLLATAFDADVAAFEYSSVPAELVGELLGGRTPQVALGLQNFAVPAVEVAGLTIEAREIETATTKFPMHVSLAPAVDGSLTGAVVYAASAFDPSSADAVTRHLSRVLTSIAEDLPVLVSDLAVGAAPSWTAVEVDSSRTLTEIFASTAARFPNNIALDDGQSTVTYAELDSASDAQAWELVARGAGPGAVYEIPAVRTIAYLVRMLAITKTGAAFVPIDPDLPTARLKQLRTVLSDRSPVPGRQYPDSVAYVVHTSGSTGKPKGVAVTHRGLGLLTDDAIRKYGVTSGSVVLHGYKPTFDAAILEMMLAIGAGATLAVAPREAFGGRALEEFVAERGVTHMLSTPAVLDTMAPERFDSLEVVAVGGDVLSPSTARAWSRRARMLNAYGPTECTVVTTVAEVDHRVTIGVPLTGIGAEVLDTRLHPVPWAGIGELYVSGPGLAMGYAGDPAGTASSFVAAPGGRRRYRTGDLVHRRTDDTLGFVGRSDRQMSVRGIRVEPAEIESALRRCLGVEAAAVVLVDEIAVACAVGDSLESGQLTIELAAMLPAYLMPGRVVVLESIPLTSNGKLDADALRRHVFESQAPDAAVTVSEELVTAVMSEHVSGSFGALHNLFESGGDSLAAAAVAGRLASIFARDVPVRAVFDHPSPRAMSQWLSSSASDGTRRELTRRDPGMPAPLAPSQQRLWLINQLQPESTAYNLTFAAILADGIDRSVLSSALGDVVDRHAVLRTVLVPGEFGPQQVEIDSVAFDLTPVQVDDIRASAQAFANVQFDLERDVPFRVRVFTENAGANSAGSTVLAIVVHHIAIDGASMGPILADFAAAFKARTVGKEWDRSADGISYGDYSLWARESLGDSEDSLSVAHRQLDYWSNVLRGVEDVLALPVDRPRSLLSSRSDEMVTEVLDGTTYDALSALARSHGVTVFMVVHSVIAVLLARECVTDDVVVGAAVSLRNDPALLNVAGMMVGTVALRTRINSADHFTAVLDEVRRVDLEAMANADVSFDDVVAKVDPPRRMNEHPLFTVMLAYRRALELPQIDGVSAFDIDIAGASTGYDLTWDLVDAGDSLTIRLLYATDKFRKSTAELFMQRVTRIAESVIAEPEIVVGEIELLSGFERSALTVANPRTVDPLTIADIFERALCQAPDGVALEENGQLWTYRDLHEASSHWTRELVGRGIGPDDIVAVALGRGHLWIVALWAVARAGAAWLSLDPALPTVRRQTMVEECGSVVGLTAQGAAESLPDCVEWLSMDESRTASEATEASATPARPDNLAYVIYTSGSTGRPKGVEVSHRGIMNVYTAHAEIAQLDRGPRVLQLASSTFDASVIEILLAAAGCGTLILAPDFVYGGEELTSLLVAADVTHLIVTPTVLATVDPDSVQPLIVESMGEPLSARLASAWSSRHHIVNGYGPTESTVAASISHPIIDGDVTVGTPVPGTTALVLDQRLRPVPDGVTGELFLSGENLARGYVASPGLTADRFVANPFVANPAAVGTRMYRTGDLVRRRRHDRALEYLGRNDAQVKVRGVRVEPAEVDAALSSHGAVTFSVTVVTDDGRGSAELRSYVTLAENNSATERELRDFVSGSLPKHLLPSSVTVVDRVPLLASGKIDVAALPAPAPQVGSSADRPVSATERQVAQAFESVTGAVSVGRHDDFFELGGTSMGAVQVASRLREALNREFPVQWIFTDRTVTELASRLDLDHADVLEGDSFHSDPLDTIVMLGGNPDDVRSPLFCVHPVSGIAWCYVGLVGRLEGRRVYGIQATGAGELPGTVAELASGYVDAVRMVQPSGEYHLLGWSAGGTIALEMACQLEEAGDLVGSVAMLDALLPEMMPSVQAAPEPSELFAQIGLAEVETATAAVTFVDVAAEIRRQTGMDFLTDTVLESVVGRVEKLSRIVRDHRPRSYSGSVELFVAQHDLPEHRHLVEKWSELAGSLRTYLVDCSHSEMSSMEVLASVAKVLVDNRQSIESEAGKRNHTGVQ
ncbi:amino acid adenylation domain-containing protein [Rhodococcus erythropolis]|uniref:non-ribosomal peptide synthetase n=1 Tax=Rhodococcus erythropolis TaxID=1833 RepID=UPI001E51DFAD|nr:MULTISPECIES: non-ribosomal peptide synthetase [Rhodococcus erythropolis group]MCD2104700.1 amino acid adenylation domain-containing protein [Rhodococcus qingshengii]MCZ4525174.1 amino acid adenylation domain-containing protein [Rhodococcus erythropolis]